MAVTFGQFRISLRVVTLMIVAMFGLFLGADEAAAHGGHEVEIMQYEQGTDSDLGAVQICCAHGGASVCSITAILDRTAIDAFHRTEDAPQPDRLSASAVHRLKPGVPPPILSA